MTAAKELAPAQMDDVAQIYRRYCVMVRNCARRIVRSEALAEDVMQEVFIRYMEQRRAGAAVEKPASLLYAMATNLALNNLRNHNRRAQILASAAQPHRACERPDRLIVLLNLLTRVPQEEATVAACYYLGEMQHDEIAEHLGMERRTVGRRLEKFHQRATRLLGSTP